MLQACKGINHKEISQVVGITAMENPNQSVMVNGQVIASDSPAAVRADSNVQAAYLGEH